jgi:transcriptional regulator with XRE-family HTH domain
MTLGENIVRLRTQKNWSQGDLADALEISRQSVSKWETDASIPELDKLLKLSELFGVTLDELVRGEEVPKTETAMPAAQTVPTSFAPQATPEREKRRTIAGTVLLCTGAVILVFCLLLAGDLLTGLLFASPFLICGIICFAVKQRVGLCCGWAVYLCVDLYLRFATGLSWTTIFMTHLWTAQMNYARLSIAWVQFIGMILMILYTVRSYRTLKVSATKKEITWLIVGWVAALVVLPLLMSYGVMPLWRDNLHNYSNFSPYFFINVLYSYVRLALVNVLLVRTLAVWRVKRDEKKANRNAAET